MGQRMFVSVTPPADVVDDLADFLAPRVREGGLGWVDPERWHLTLAFMAAVPTAREDELVERLAETAGRVAPFDLTLVGAGCFPDPTRAKVLWIGVDPAAAELLARLAAGSRAAAGVCGASPDGRAFVPHLTLARSRRPIEATRWLRVLDTWRSRPWPVTGIDLVASHLHEGRRGGPRHEVVAGVALGG